MARTTQTLDQNSDYRGVECRHAGGKEPELVWEVERQQLELVGLPSTSTLLEPDSLRSTPSCVLILNVIFLYSGEFHTNNRKPKTFSNSPLHHHVCSSKILLQFLLCRPFLYTFTVCIVFKTAFYMYYIIKVRANSSILTCHSNL